MNKAGILTLLVSRAQRSQNHCRSAVHRMEERLAFGRAEPEVGFFDSYPRFYSTSVTRAEPNRLNRRYVALIVANEAIIRGKSVLDIASHDGRWSFAAYKTGARRVLGIEARQHLVNNAQANMREYHVPEESVQFVLGDVFEELDRLEPGTIETVFCFGFLYHTIHHMLLLSKIARLRPEHLVLDTRIDVHPYAIIEVYNEGVSFEASAAVPGLGAPTRTVVGVPTRSALELMLSNSAFTSFRYYDWRRAGIKRWEGLAEYDEGRRISMVATWKSK